MVKPLTSLPDDFRVRVVTATQELIYTPENPSEALAFGAEGSIFPLKETAADGTRLSLKFYHPEYLKNNDRVKKKVHAMVHPDQLRRASAVSKKHSHDFIFEMTSHPRAAAYTPGGNFIGYIMKHFDDSYPLSRIQNKVSYSKFDDPEYSVPVQYAYALSVLVYTVHRAGYIIGDMNPKNFVVSDKTYVYAVDVDSFQFRNNGELYRSSGRIKDWLHPDLHTQEWTELELKPEHDYFALAKLIFQLLMFGENPYACVYNDPLRDVTGADAVRYRHYPYSDLQAKNHGIKIRPGAIHPKFLSTSLSALFERAFLGKLEDIPDTREWAYALEKFQNSLKVCDRNKSHSHNKDTVCPMCAMEIASEGAFTYYTPTFPDGIYPKKVGKKKDQKPLKKPPTHSPARSRGHRSTIRLKPQKKSSNSQTEEPTSSSQPPPYTYDRLSNQLKRQVVWAADINSYRLLITGHSYPVVGVPDHHKQTLTEPQEGTQDDDAQYGTIVPPLEYDELSKSDQKRVKWQPELGCYCLLTDFCYHPVVGYPGEPKPRPQDLPHALNYSQLTHHYKTQVKIDHRKNLKYVYIQGLKYWVADK